MARFLPLIFLQLFVLAFSHQVVAQQPDEANSLLPEINPQDIEIRSEFRARFPGLNRQPILGFDPKPRVYQIDPARRPFMETQEQVVANLPISELSRPAPPLQPALRYAPHINAYSRLGIGSYMSPEAQFWGVHRINKKSYIGGDFDYASSDGHLEGQESSFRFMNANVDFATKVAARTQLHFTGGIQSDFNHFFDLVPNLNVPDNSKKNYTGFNLEGDVRHLKNTIEGWTGRFDFRYFGVEADAGDVSGQTDESIYSGMFANRWAGQNLNEVFTVQAGAIGGVYTLGGEEQQWSTLRGGMEYSRLFNYTTQLTGQANIYYTSDVMNNTFYFGPYLKVDHFISNKLKVTGILEGRPFLRTVEQHHETNRFLNAENHLRHSYHLDIAAEASYEYFSGSQLSAGISFLYAHNYAYYSRTSLSSRGTTFPEYGFYSINYMDAQNLRFFAALTHQLLPERFWLSGQFYVQDPALHSDERIPFKETWGLNSSMTVRPLNRLTIEGWADYIGRRKTARGDDLDAFLLIGGRAELGITDRIGAYVKLVNLLNQDYEIWEGYTERPLQIYGGVTITLP
mgnify:CR=1 FL=1